jgi:hypothetical protein
MTHRIAAEMPSHTHKTKNILNEISILKDFTKLGVNASKVA